MIKIQPFNNIVFAEQLTEEKKETSGIILPDKQIGRFVKLRIIAIGKLVEGMKPGDIVYANPVLEIVDMANPKVGFINSKDIFAKEVKEIDS